MMYFVIWVFLGIITAMVASNKNRSTFLWLILGLLFGIFSLIVILILKPIKDPVPVKKVVKKAMPKPKPSTADEITKLSELLEKGHITEEEFKAQKEKILA